MALLFYDYIVYWPYVLYSINASIPDASTK